MKVIDPRAMGDKTFPAGVRSLWKAALAAEVMVRCTLARGQIIGQGGKLLEEAVPNLCLTMVRSDGKGAVAEWHYRNEAWKFIEAWQYNPALRLTAKEVRTWLTGPEEISQATGRP